MRSPTGTGSFNTSTNRLASITYDSAGDQTVVGSLTLVYDAESRQTKATDSTSGDVFTYSYDGLGQRVTKVAGGVTTTYVHDVFGNLAAEYTSGTLPDVPCTTCYVGWDHLGTTRLVTDLGGFVVARHDHLPFGAELPAGFAGRTDLWGQTDTLTAKFTSQERDSETGNDFFNARYAASAIGRFLSPDPDNAGADPTGPNAPQRDSLN